MNVLIILHRFNQTGYIYDRNNRGKKYNYFAPIGLAYLSAVIKKAGYDVTCLNLNHHCGKTERIVGDAVTAKDYDVVFIGGVSIYYPQIRDLISYIRIFAPATKIVAGGGIITSQPELMMKLLKPDYGVIGEGEETVVEFLRWISNGGDIANVDGIAYYNKKGELVTTGQRQAIQNLDSLPFPDYDAFGYSEYLYHAKPSDFPGYEIEDRPRFYPLLASRGCPFFCNFCFHTLGPKYRQRSIDNVMEELKLVIPKYRINIVIMYDELFAQDKERVYEFCDKFKAFTDTLAWKVHFSTQMRVCDVDIEMLRKMKDAGCYLIGFGLESYSQKVLDNMKKHISPTQICWMFLLMNHIGIGVQGTFIFGDPAETRNTAKETLDFYTGNPGLIRGGVSAGFVIPFQGSPVYKQCVQRRIIMDETKFIEDRISSGYNYNEPINMTIAMDDKQFNDLKNRVLTAHLTAWDYVVPTDNEDGSISAVCPYCGETTRFRNYLVSSGFGRNEVGCRHCLSRFVITSKRYPLERFLIKTFGFNAIYSLKKLVTS